MSDPTAQGREAGAWSLVRPGGSHPGESLAGVDPAGLDPRA